MGAEFIIQNANLIDGAGNPPRLSCLHVKDGRILRISQEHLAAGPDVELVDAEGLCLAPGFIDTHGHSDVSILAAPEAEGKISQGVTTEICGNCGLSVFPITDMNREHLEAIYRSYGVKLDWSGVREYAAKVDSARPAINIASLAGHNTLRAAVCGYDQKLIPKESVSRMRFLLDGQLSSGALGFSTGLLYVPGIFSDAEEIAGMLKTNAKFARPHATHLRSEGDGLIESVEEAITLCRRSASPRLHISHLKTAGRRNWGKLDQVVEIIGRQASCMDVSADRYPYTESMTNLSAYLPSLFREMDDVRIAGFLSVEDGWNQGLSVLSELGPEFWTAMRLVATSLPGYACFQGMKFDEISARLGRPSVRICLDLLRDAPSAVAASSGMSDENMRRIISLPFVACGSDESCRNRDYGLGRSHPRGFGSFARFFKIASEKMPVEQVVRKLTSLPAAIFGLRGRGLVKEGYAADLVLFAPEKLKDNASFADPHRISDGVEKVWVSGVLSWDSGEATGDRGGGFLKA